MSDTAAPVSLYDELQVGDELGPMAYLYTADILERYRQAVGDPNALYPLQAKRHIAALYMQRFPQAHVAGLHTCHESEFFAVPEPGTRILVHGKVVDKYLSKGKPYVVAVATVTDEHGRLLERTRETWMCNVRAAGEKWW